MDAKELINSLTVDEIKTILIELGAQHIEDLSDTKGHLITNTICHNISDGKMKLYYYTESNGKFEGRKFHCFTACGDNFNIYELVKRNHELKGVEMRFPDVINWICSKTGRKNYGYTKPEGFGHEEVKINEELEYLKKFDKKKIEAPILVEHDEYILGRFTNHHHQSWLEDGISHEAMSKFNVKFDYVGHKIIVPHLYYKNGKMIGIKARELNQDSIDKGYKYVPYQTYGETGILYSYPTHYNLYGLWENRKHIEETRRILIVESEKGVMQAETMFPEQNFTVALCGSSISEAQCKMITDMNIETVYIGLDKEYENIDSEQFNIYQKKVLQMVYSLIPYAKVKIVHDSSGDKLPHKGSPTDCGRDVLIELMKDAKIVNLIED